MDYSAQKVPDLKKLLSDRGLVVSGVKADLVARLEEDDKKKDGGKPAAEDEIDWDEDDTKPDNKTAAAPAAVVAAGGQGPVETPIAVPNQKVDVDPSTTTDLKVVGGEATQKDGDVEVIAASGPTTSDTAPAVPEAPKEDFTMGIEQSDAEKEAAKRAQRAKRFGIPEDEEAKKLAERAKKFGSEVGATVVKGLDAALPERRPKRARDVREDKQGGGRSAKRQTPDRRTAPAPKAERKPAGRILDDPEQKLKAEARAKRFQAGA